MARAKKAVEAAPKRRGRPPGKKSSRTKAQKTAIPMPPAPEPGPGYKYRWVRKEDAEQAGLVFAHEPVPMEIQAIELALVRLRRIAASLRLASTGMDVDQSDATIMATELIDGAQEAIAEALVMIREGK